MAYQLNRKGSDSEEEMDKTARMPEEADLRPEAEDDAMVRTSSHILSTHTLTNLKRKRRRLK